MSDAWVYILGVVVAVACVLLAVWFAEGIDKKSLQKISKYTTKLQQTRGSVDLSEFWGYVEREATQDRIRKYTVRILSRGESYFCQKCRTRDHESTFREFSIFDLTYFTFIFHSSCGKEYGQLQFKNGPMMSFVVEGWL